LEVVAAAEEGLQRLRAAIEEAEEGEHLPRGLVSQNLLVFFRIFYIFKSVKAGLVEQRALLEEMGQTLLFLFNRTGIRSTLSVFLEPLLHSVEQQELVLDLRPVVSQERLH
jgi:hypothetical protein